MGSYPSQNPNSDQDGQSVTLTLFDVLRKNSHFSALPGAHLGLDSGPTRATPPPNAVCRCLKSTFQDRLIMALRHNQTTDPTPMPTVKVSLIPTRTDFAGQTTSQRLRFKPREKRQLGCRIRGSETISRWPLW